MKDYEEVLKLDPRHIEATVAVSSVSLTLNERCRRELKSSSQCGTIHLFNKELYFSANSFSRAPYSLQSTLNSVLASSSRQASLSYSQFLEYKSSSTQTSDCQVTSFTTFKRPQQKNSTKEKRHFSGSLFHARSYGAFSVLLRVT